MMKSRRQQTSTPERQQEQTTSILESESKTGEIVIYLSLFIWVLLTETSLGAVFIFTSFIFFYAVWKACVYVIKIEPWLTEIVMHFMDEPKGNPNVDRRQCLSAANVSLGLMFYRMSQLVWVADVADVDCGEKRNRFLKMNFSILCWKKKIHTSVRLCVIKSRLSFPHFVVSADVGGIAVAVQRCKTQR